MTTLPERIFYSLSTLVLGAALFVLSPQQSQIVSDFQNQAKQQFAIAAVQVFGDQPVLDTPIAVIQSINEFYDQSATAMLSLLEPSQGQDEQMVYVATAVYNDFRLALNPNRNMAVTQSRPEVLGTETKQSDAEIVIPKDFMQGEPLHNIVPDGYKPPVSVAPDESQIIAAVQTTEYAQSPADSTWVSMKDGTTGQVYCVAIFNSEVNRYLGPCKNDYK